MKKVFFTILSLFILSCSSDDNNNDNNPSNSINSDLVGTWVGAITDDEDPTSVGVQTIVFSADGTGSVTTAIVLTGESDVSDLTWYSNATTIFGTLDDQLDEIGYVLAPENNELQLTFPEGDVVEYARVQ